MYNNSYTSAGCYEALRNRPNSVGLTNSIANRFTVSAYQPRDRSAQINSASRIETLNRLLNSVQLDGRYFI